MHVCLIEVIYCASICTKVIPSRRVLNTFCIKRIASFFLSNIKCLSKAILSCVLVPAISFDDIEYIKKTEKKSDPKKYLKIWRVDHSKGTLHVKSLKKIASHLCVISYPPQPNRHRQPITHPRARPARRPIL